MTPGGPRTLLLQVKFFWVFPALWRPVRPWHILISAKIYTALFRLAPFPLPWQSAKGFCKKLYSGLSRVSWNGYSLFKLPSDPVVSGTVSESWSHNSANQSPTCEACGLCWRKLLCTWSVETEKWVDGASKKRSNEGEVYSCEPQGILVETSETFLLLFLPSSVLWMF